MRALNPILSQISKTRKCYNLKAINQNLCMNEEGDLLSQNSIQKHGIKFPMES